MVVFVLVMLVVLATISLQRMRRPGQFWWMGLLGILFTAWFSFYATTNHWGVEEPMKQGESIRQDSTQRRTSYFGYYSSRSHMGGGLMGGK